MNRTLRLLAALAILAMLALIVAVVSNAPAGTGSTGGNNIAVTYSAPTGTGSSGGITAAPTPGVPAETGTSSSGDNKTVATPGAPAGTGSSGGNTAAVNHEQAVKFAECMRANGVSEFPDPGASGEFTIDEIANRSSVDTSTAAFEQAMNTCKDLQPAGFTGHKRSPQEQENALKFAQCIRDNGVPDFPDPAVDEPMIDTNRIPSTANGDLSILHAAMDKCRGIIADQLRGQ